MGARLTRLALALAAWLLAAAAAQAGTAHVDAGTLTGKLIFGYQGWFACPGDAAGRGWVHWRDAKGFTVDMLPDVAELPGAERCDAGLRAPDGAEVDVYSAQNRATVDRHFAWMARYGLDGVALQRFATGLLHDVTRQAMDRVLANVRAGAEAHGRVFFVMYDLSGMTSDQLPLVAADWARLVGEGLTGSPAYLRHRGHPLVALWGLGFSGRPITPQASLDLIDAIEKAGGASLLGGVATGWREGNRDASPDPGWRAVWKRLAVISPWTVGRYADEAGAARYARSDVAPGLAAAAALGADYMPVVFPGFTWRNLQHARDARSAAPYNQTPRRCGRFWWRQMVEAVRAGATMVYGAMFDEVDEGTAMFKLVARAADEPTDPGFVALDADGCALPSDFYLRLAGEGAALLRAPAGAGDAFPLPLVPAKP